VTVFVEHLATRRVAGLFDFSFMGLCEFQGRSELHALGFAHPESSVGSLACLVDGRIARVATLPFYDPQHRRPRAMPL